MTTTSRTSSSAGIRSRDGRAGQSDARSQVEDVHGPERLAEDLHPTGRRVDLGPGQLQDRGLARPVGTQHDPALVLGDHPVQPVDDGAAAAKDGHLAEAEHLDHAAHPTRASTGAPGRDVPYPPAGGRRTDDRDRPVAGRVAARHRGVRRSPRGTGAGRPGRPCCGQRAGRLPQPTSRPAQGGASLGRGQHVVAPPPTGEHHRMAARRERRTDPGGPAQPRGPRRGPAAPRTDRMALGPCRRAPDRRPAGRHADARAPRPGCWPRSSPMPRRASRRWGCSGPRPVLPHGCGNRPLGWLPPSLDPQAQALLVRLAALHDALDLARVEEGAAVTAAEVRARAAELQQVLGRVEDLVAGVVGGLNAPSAAPVERGARSTARGRAPRLTTCGPVRASRRAPVVWAHARKSPSTPPSSASTVPG